MVFSRSVAVAGVAALFVLAPMGAAQAGQAAGSEQIDDYKVDMVLKQDATMHVKETIVYDFADEPDKHGIIRQLLTKFRYSKTEDREYPISDISVTVDGSSSDPEVSSDEQTALKIGDAGTTVTGKHTYVIEYDLGGVVNSFSDHQELYWNAIGDQWSVPIAKASATVEGPAAVQKVACYRGNQGSTAECDGSIAGNGAASFSIDRPLDTGQGMTVVSSFPVGTFPGAGPILVEHRTLASGFAFTPVTVGGSSLLLVLLAGGVGYLVSQRGRDERYLGVTPGLEPGYQQEHSVSRMPMFGRPPVAVQFQPPTGMRPGQLGTLIDEEANVVDVTATIVDLAVRGWLKIEEVESPGFMKKGDWRLTEVTPAPSEQLHDYETKLFNSIFSGRSSVLLSDLKETFKSDLQSVQSLLYADVTSAGWFRGTPPPCG